MSVWSPKFDYIGINMLSVFCDSFLCHWSAAFAYFMMAILSPLRISIISRWHPFFCVRAFDSVGVFFFFALLLLFRCRAFQLNTFYFLQIRIICTRSRYNILNKYAGFIMCVRHKLIVTGSAQRPSERESVWKKWNKTNKYIICKDFCVCTCFFLCVLFLPRHLRLTFLQLYDEWCESKNEIHWKKKCTFGCVCTHFPRVLR